MTNTNGLILGQYNSKTSGIFWKETEDLFFFEQVCKSYPLVFSEQTYKQFDFFGVTENLKLILTGRKTVISNKKTHKFKIFPDILRYFSKINYKGRYCIIGDSIISKQALIYNSVRTIAIISDTWPYICDSRYYLKTFYPTDYGEYFFYGLF